MPNADVPSGADCVIGVVPLVLHLALSCSALVGVLSASQDGGLNELKLGLVSSAKQGKSRVRWRPWSRFRQLEDTQKPCHERGGIELVPQARPDAGVDIRD